MILCSMLIYVCAHEQGKKYVLSRTTIITKRESMGVGLSSVNGHRYVPLYLLTDWS